MKPLASLRLDEIRDLVRVHAKMFAFERYSRLHPLEDEEQAHAFAARHWHQFRDISLDYLSVAMALDEKEAAASN